MLGVHGPDLARTLRRDKRPFWWAIIGGLVLAAYGVVATYQPPGLDFGRVYAAYGFVCCTCACPPARRRLLCCGRLQPAWTVVTGCGCRGYFILLSLLWGIYIDKSLVCAWSGRWRLLPCAHACSHVGSLVQSELDWHRHSLIDDAHACPHMRHVRMHFSSLSPSSRLSPVLFLSLNACTSVSA
jgi:drug/metabolite transporter superfamily protein YnfA